MLINVRNQEDDYLKKITDEEVLRLSDELFKQIEAENPPERKSNCKFWGEGKGRYCLASSHTTCDKCRYFKPTIVATFRTLVKNNEKLKYMIEKLTIEKNSLELKVKMLESMMLEEGEDYEGKSINQNP